MKAVNPCGLKRAALINDLSCFGKCSLSVSMPILSSYGIETVASMLRILNCPPRTDYLMLRWAFT